MQFVDLKKTDKVDWQASLTKFIKKEYVKDAYESHKDAAEKLSTLRRDIHVATERNEPLAQLYMKYYHTLTHIDQRFPVNEDNIKIPFVWYDAFRNKQKITMYRIGFEKACILYNLGAIYSGLGAHQNLTTLDGLKEACRYFQIAAGFFAKLKEDIVFVVGQLSTDLSNEGLEGVINLMLGQAQECFCERAFRQNMKPSVVAPLAASAARFYDKAFSCFELPLIKGSLERNWTSYAPFKFNYMMGLHHYCMSRIAHDEEKYGVECAYLQLADQHLMRCRSFGVPPEVAGSLNSLLPQVQRALQQANYDNERIYHERVPRAEELPAGAMKDMVKPAPIMPLLDAARAGTEIFGALLPLGVKKSIDKYNEDKVKLVAMLTDEMKSQSKQAQERLTEMNLPDCLHVMDAVSIPEGLQRDIAAFKASNGPLYLQELHAQVQSMADETRRMHSAVIDSLDTEEREDTELCQRFGRVWTRMPSSQLNRAFRADLATYSHNIEAAKKSDAVLQRKMESYQPEFALLMMPQDQLEAMVPRGAPSNLLDAPADTRDATAELKDLLTQLDAVMTERQNIIKSIEQLAAQEGGITNELLMGGRTHEEIIAQALTAFDPDRRKAAELLQRQQALLERITVTHRMFMAQRSSSELLTAKEAAIKRLRDGVNHYREVKSNTSEGMEFYSKMQDVLRQLKMKIDDFLYARATEKQDLMQRIQMMQQGPPQVVSSQGPLYQSTGAPGMGGAPPHPQVPVYQQPVYQQPQPQQQQPPSYPQEYGGYRR